VNRSTPQHPRLPVLRPLAELVDPPGQGPAREKVRVARWPGAPSCAMPPGSSCATARTGRCWTLAARPASSRPPSTGHSQPGADETNGLA